MYFISQLVEILFHHSRDPMVETCSQARLLQHINHPGFNLSQQRLHTLDRKFTDPLRLH